MIAHDCRDQRHRWRPLLQPLVERQRHHNECECHELKREQVHQIHAEVVVSEQDDLLDRVDHAG